MNAARFYPCRCRCRPFTFQAFACFLLAGSIPIAFGWDTRVLHEEFYAEGAGFGDIDGDGQGDLVSGPFWWKGPEFEDRYAYYEAETSDIKRYSENFFCHVADIDSDGDNDILIFGFPGKEARLYLNSGDPVSNRNWDMRVIADQVSHESPDFVDIVPGGVPEIVCSRDRAFGYYEAGADPLKPWVWRPVSQTGETVPRFGHGLGVGDLDGDGDLDLVDRFSWWENPSGSSPEGLWKKRVWLPGTNLRGGAQIEVDDVDGDGRADIVTSLNGHGFGLAWFRQVAGPDGECQFEQNLIMGESSVENPFGVAVSQLHGLALRDIDGDGWKDIVTGKRWHAHFGKDPGNNQEPVVYWLRREKTEEGVQFVPYLIHNDSGVGVDVLVEDMNRDGRLDVVSASKRGVAIHFQEGDVLANRPELWQVPGGRPDTDWAFGLDAREAAERMGVAEGFRVDLIAAEPDIVQPIAMCFDARGRIWVVEGRTYPQRARGAKGADRIVILEDSDGDGDFETHKVFADELNLVSGIEVGFGGVWVGAAPYLLFYPDADGDDLPDSEPKVLLDGWGYQDTHETLNSFRWGPDGWLYGCHGVFTHSNVGKPGTADEDRAPINAGIWRYHPTEHEFEVFAWGISNPWGLDFDANGDWYSTACVIPHYYQVIQGGRYFRQAGQHFNPYVYDDIKTIADHLHYGDGTFNSMRADGKVDRALQREKAADTSAVGGGHAHAGLVIYQADAFPEAYRGDSFFHNLHGHRIVRETFERDGSGVVARHGPDFALANDHSFIGVALMQGPDGALYASDWHDPQTCHHRDPDIWDRSDGRIFRIRYGNQKADTIDLAVESTTKLVARLHSSNAFLARQAQRLLQERAVAGDLDKGDVSRSLKEILLSNAEAGIRLRAFWTLYACGLLDEELSYQLLADRSEYVRGWAVYFQSQAGEALPTRVLARWEDMARSDASSVVRRYIASAIQRVPQDQRWSLIEALSSRLADINDQNIPLLVWYALEPLVAKFPGRAVAIAGNSQWPKLDGFAQRRAAEFEDGRDALLSYVAASSSAREFLSRGEGYLTALGERTGLERPDSMEAFLNTSNRFNQNNVSVMTLRIRARLGDEDAFPYWRELLADSSRLPRLRREALEVLTLGGDVQIGAVAATLLSDPEFRETALSTLASHLDDSSAERLIEALPDFPLRLRNEGINVLGSRANTTLALLEAIDAGDLAPSLVSPALMRQMRSHGDARIVGLMDSLWGEPKATPDDLPRQVRRWRFALTPERLRRADLSYGRHVYANTCGTCHTLFDEGVALGPDLTGSNRANLDYILENVLAPNALVGNAYQLNLITADDGRSYSGMVTAEDDSGLTLALPGGVEVSLNHSEVASRSVLEQSMMPTGLFDAIPEDDVAALVAYLASPQQVEKWQPDE